MADVNWPDLQVKVPPGDPPQTLLEMAYTITGLDASVEDTLRTALNLSGQAVETYIDRVLAKREVTNAYAHQFGVLELREWPMDPTPNPMFTVTVNGTPSNAYTAFTNGPSVFIARQNQKPDAPHDWRGFDQVEVTYTAGYDPLPADLAQSIVYTATAVLDGFGEGSLPGTALGEVKKQTVHGVGSIEYVNATPGLTVALGDGWGVIPAIAAQIMSKYKRMTT